MFEPTDENERRRAAANFLHFEDENPAKWDVYFDTFEEAIDFVNERGWSFASEDWEPAGLFEGKIECKDEHGSVVGQLLMLRIKITG